MGAASVATDQFLDPLWRLNNLYWIVDKDGRECLFNLNPSQAQIVEDLHGRDIVLKARQLGFTTLFCLISLDEAFFMPNHRAGIIAHKLDDAKSIFESKVKFPYEHLPDQLRNANPLVKDSADTLALSNGSSVEVKTSARSGTYQRLHISEFGKICATQPEKAREIVTGSLPAAERGQITIESTAEGQEGRFYEMCQEAQKRDPRSRLEFKFHFFPWFKDTAYAVPSDWADLTPEDREYFARLEAQGIDLTPEQKAWWVITERQQGGDMLREYPATPEEAFEQAIEGAIFERQLAHSRKHGHIGAHKFDPSYPVNSFWDIGKNDLNVIWLHQHIRGRNRFIGYYENSGELISHYVTWLRDWAKEHEASWSDHYLPHDGARSADMFNLSGKSRLETMDDLGFRPEIVERPPDKWDAVETARTAFAGCDFDEVECAKGIRRLGNYRKEYDERRGAFRNKPLHDDNSNAADAFMTFSAGFEPKKPAGKVINMPNVIGTIA